MNHLVFFAMLAVLAPAPTPPGEAMEARLAARFAAADKNHDGKLTLEEAQAGMPRVARGFALIDTGKKGYVTLAEIRAFAAARQ